MTTIDNYINDKLMKQIYFAYNRLFYDYQKLSRCIKKQVLIIFDSYKNLCVISIDPTLKKDSPNIFNKILVCLSLTAHSLSEVAISFFETEFFAEFDT